MSADGGKIEVGNPEAAKRRKIGGDLYIEVTGYAGAHVHSIIRQMVALATRINIDVWCDLNGCRTLARPFDNWEALIEAYEAEQANESRPKYKHAST